MKDNLTIFACGPDPNHKCDDDGPEAKIMSECRKCEGTGTVSPHGGILNCPKCKGSGLRESGSSVSCSVCGMSAYDRSFWEDP
jgi:DnaJ-class molecular chaperone